MIPGVGGGDNDTESVEKAWARWWSNKSNYNKKRFLPNQNRKGRKPTTYTRNEVPSSAGTPYRTNNAKRTRELR